ncbi:uncharacterized protein LOC128220023 [Mya arenaria]|uniref:uncharacterized protein LOC128220023 n=1 Tax=Mya arenaria TaxID=6604 RepID=UPI0022E4D961|nr:uncharacterized protein LOC128220023 [Mya arenaria]
MRILNLTLIVFGLPTLIHGTAEQDLKKLEEDFWSWRMRNNPSTSTFQGLGKYDDLMESYNITTFETRRIDTEAFRNRLLLISRVDLDPSGKVNYDILNDTLETFLEGNKWAEYGALSPISFLGGIQLYYGPYFSYGSSRGDFENYIARLRAVQTQVNEIKELGRRAIALNRTLHNVSMAKVPGQIDRLIFDHPENSSYFLIFGDELYNNSNIQNQTEKDEIKSRGSKAVVAYMDAMTDLKTFITDEYMPAARSQWGVYAWDSSNNYYRACLKWHLSFEMSPEDVHNLGIQEVDKITTAMHKILDKQDFKGTVSDFFKSLENDTRAFSDNQTYILQFYNDTVFKRINPKLGKLFKDIPDVPLEIKASSSDGLGGGYSSASETSPGRFTINLFRPKEVPLFEAMALSLHEANPGHHMQHSYSMKADLPDFRRDPMLSFYNIPNWFPYYSSYQEGWGLYSEYLGEELGLYEDDYEMMGRYSYDILRACRLVVDTGLHYYRWSREEAITYLQNYTAMAYGSAANEIDRYITWPGQACAYKVGEIKIRELRKHAEDELGSRFNIQEFHLQVLENGAMPMSVLESLIKRWIQDIKSETSAGVINTSNLLTLSAFYLSYIILFK